MVGLEVIRKDMESLLEQDKSLNAIEVNADSLGDSFRCVLAVARHHHYVIKAKLFELCDNLRRFLTERIFNANDRREPAVDRQIQP